MKLSLKSNDLALECKTKIIINLSYSFCNPFERFCMLRFSNKALSVVAFFVIKKDGTFAKV